MALAASSSSLILEMVVALALLLQLVRSCDQGQFNSSEGCTDCTPGCQECSSAQSCSLCFDQHYLAGGDCVRCSANCESCISEDCQLCSSGFALVNFECIDCNVPGWLLGDEDCWACPASCHTCNSTLSCSSCPEHAYLATVECRCENSHSGLFFAPKFVERRGREGLVLECQALECHPACQSCSGPGWSECLAFKCAANELWSEFSKECVSHCSNFERAQGSLCLFDYSLRQSEQFRGELVVLIGLASLYLVCCLRLVHITALEPVLLLTLMGSFVGFLNYASDLMLLFTLQGFFKQLATLSVLLARLAQALLGVVCIRYVARKDDLFNDWVSGQLYHRPGKSCRTLALAFLASASALPLVTYEWRKEGLSAHCRQQSSLLTLRRLGWYVSLVTAFIENPVMSAAIVDYIRQEMFPGWFLVFGLMVNWLCMVRVVAYVLLQSTSPLKDSESH